MRFEFEVRAALESHPTVESLRVTLRDRHGLSEASTDGFLESIVSHIFRDAGDRYVGDVSARLRHIEQLRGELHRAVSDVVAGNPLPPEASPENLARLFDDLQNEMNGIVSPRDYVNANPTDAFGLRLEDAAPPRDMTPADTHPHTSSPRHSAAPEAIGNWFDQLPPEDSSLFEQASDAAHQEMSQLIHSDSSEHTAELTDNLRDRLRQEGFTDDQIDRVVELTDRAGTERAQRDRGLPARVQQLVGWDPLLVQMSRDHPDLLMELARDFDRNGGGHRSAFSRHVRQELRRRGIEISVDAPIPRVRRPRGTASPPEIRVEPTRRLNPGEVARNATTGETVVCNYAGPGHERLGFEKDMYGAVEVGLDGWHRAHSQGAGTGKESSHGILYAPPEVNLGYQNLGIERYIREAVGQLDPGAQMILTTATRAHPDSLRLASIEYKVEIEVDGVRTTVLEAGLQVENVRDNPKVTSWAEAYENLEQFLR